MKNITEILPHRYPFLLIDKVVEIQSDKHIKAYKNVSYNEPFFNGHFPGHPVMPGVLQIEAIAQAAAILCAHSQDFDPEKHVAYLAGIEEARFRRLVVPGDRLMIEVEILKSKRGLVKASGVASVDGERACEAIITAVVRNRQ